MIYTVSTLTSKYTVEADSSEEALNKLANEDKLLECLEDDQEEYFTVLGDYGDNYDLQYVHIQKCTP